MTLADKIVVLRAIVVAQMGALVALYHDPANKVVAGFTGCRAMNFLKVKLKATKFFSALFHNFRLSVIWIDHMACAKFLLASAHKRSPSTKPKTAFL